MLAVALPAALALSGCGSHGGPYGWLRPAAPPAGWPQMRIPNGAAVAYPAGWRRLHGDPGSATVASIAAGGRFEGYLNLTPRQGQEQLSTWASFRLEHNQEEGDRRVTERSHTASRPFRGGRAACVSDSYVTSVGGSYTEIACLIEGKRAATVVVAAAPPDDWSKVSPALERAISTLTT